MHLKIGTRGSKLALKNTDIVIAKLSEHYRFTHEVIVIKTSGDIIQDKPLYDIGGKALFLKELEEALVCNNIDVAVHSLKDVPGVIHGDFALGAVLEREEAHDCLVSLSLQSITDFPPNIKLGTSSPRRISRLRQLNPDIDIYPLRGNIDTRLRRLYSGEFEAIILAKVGLQRLNLWDKRTCFEIDVDQMIPAVGQGAITVEFLKKREELAAILSVINHKPTSTLINIEREFLATLHATCRTPVAAHAQFIDETKIKAQFMLAEDNFTNPIMAEYIVSPDQAFNLGARAAKELSDKLNNKNHSASNNP